MWVCMILGWGKVAVCVAGCGGGFGIVQVAYSTCWCFLCIESCYRLGCAFLVLQVLYLIWWCANPDYNYWVQLRVGEHSFDDDLYCRIFISDPWVVFNEHAHSQFFMCFEILFHRGIPECRCLFRFHLKLLLILCGLGCDVFL